VAITQTIEVDVSTARLHAFVVLIEKHAAAIRADLEEFMAAESQGPGGEEERM
jgi:hypothetical protein